MSLLSGGRSFHLKTGEQGFEPQLNGSEPFVLPLHNSPKAKLQRAIL